MFSEPLKEKMKFIKCIKHGKYMTHIDLQKISQDGTRIMCGECEIRNGSVTKYDFNEICQSLIAKKQSLIDKIQKQYLETLEQINNLLQGFDQKVRNQIFNTSNDKMLQLSLKSAFYDPGYGYNHKYGLKEFETLAQIVSQELEFIQMNDQKQAESAQYLELIKLLLTHIQNFFLQNNLASQLQDNENNVKIIQNVDNLQIQEKLETKDSSHITGLYLNFDETLLAVKFAESKNFIQFWTLNETQKQWTPYHVLQCHGQNLLDFSFSKIQNSFVTAGLDKTENKKGEWNQQTFSLIQWNWLGEKTHFKEQEKFYEEYDKRIQRITQNNSQSLLIASQGGRLIIFSFTNNQYIQEFQRQISSEIICDINFCEDQDSFCFGTYDSKVYICSFIDKKFQIIQQLKLIGIPKQVIFGNENLELFILFKDGMLSINVRDNLECKFKEIQRIVNNIEKFRAIEISNQLKVLALGGETNVLQMWKKNDNMQWKCQSQFKQDNFINCIRFSHLHKQMLSSNNNEIFIHSF